MRLRRAHRGFTLFEVILASAIFVVLAGGVYFAVSSSVRAADEVGREQLDSRQLDAFVDFLREGLVNLPSEARISVRVAGDGGLRLIVTRAAGAFAAGATASQGAGVIVAALPNGDGTLDVRLARFPGRLEEAARQGGEVSEHWLPLLAGAAVVRWRFYDRYSRRYVETWDNDTERPDLIELTLGLPGAAPRSFLFQSSHRGAAVSPKLP